MTIKRATFKASDLKLFTGRQRWYACPECLGVLYLGESPPRLRRAPRCLLCSAFCAPCTPDRDPRPLTKGRPS